MAKGRRNDSGDAESGRGATPEGGEAPATAVVAAPVKRSARSAPRPAKGAVEDDDEEAGDGEADGEDDEPEAVDAELVDDDAIVGAAEPADDEVVETDEVIEAPASKSEGALTRFDPMAAYLREVQRHPLLTPEATKELAIRFQTTQDPAAAAMLVTSNLRLVVKIAYEYRRAYKNIMDLVQEGNIGLMQAVKRYDPYRGVKLSTYAALWIRAYILRYVINNWRLVKLGTTQVQRKLFFNLRKKRAELQAMGIDPTHAEIAKQLDVPEHEVAEMDVRLASGEKSLDAPVGDADGSSTTRIDLMPATGDGPEALAASEEMQTLLKAKLGEFRVTLEGKEKDLAIFDERLVADEPLTLQELGDRFGISRERVRQLEQRLTTKLRLFLSEELGDATEVLLTLYVVATPIGNLEDITLRAVRILREAPCVAAEDTRHSMALLQHLGIAGKRVVSLHAHSTDAQVERLATLLEEGQDIALLTDAGTPVVSDPGDALVRAAIVRGVTVVPIPGPSAVLTALVGSGLGGGPFRFVGFLPREGTSRSEALASAASATECVLVFESPNRVRATLEDLAAIAPTRPACVARELTKMHEEFTRGTLAELAALEREWLGEVTLVLGAQDRPGASVTDDALDERIDAELAKGGHAKGVAERLAAWSGRARRDVYERVVARKQKGRS